MRDLIFTECECNEEGSGNDGACHQTTGVCTCKAGWFGNKCQGKLKLSPMSQWSEHKDFINSMSG